MQSSKCSEKKKNKQVEIVDIFRDGNYQVVR